jgi:mannose-6-phosphate isomerase-like protein (cupin superfamily)
MFTGEDTMAEIVDLHLQKLNIHEDFMKTTLMLPNDQLLGLAWMEGEFIPHKHNMDEVFLVLEGHLSMEVEGEIRELDPGMAILIRKGERHMSKSSIRTLVAFFEPKEMSIEFV